MMLREIICLACCASCTAAFAVGGGGGCVQGQSALTTASAAARRVATPRLQFAFPDDEDAAGDDDSGGEPPADESFSTDEESAEVNDFRAQLLRQMLGGSDAPDDDADPVGQLLGNAGGSAAPPPPGPPQVRQATALATGQVLVANPERFCSRNPFSRPVKDLNRFGLRGPIDDDDDLSPDVKAQMLPVVLLIDHGKEGSRGLLMERRTGALMGDVSMDDYGCVAISPLWLGGTANQNSLYTVHDVEGVAGASEISEGLFLGGWSEVQPRVSDSSVSDARFKFFLGATEWRAGQLEEEVKAGAWITLECAPAVVIRDRVTDWRPGQPKPVWTELLQQLARESADVTRIIAQVYPEE